MAQLVQNLPASARDARGENLVPGSGRQPGEGNGNLLQHPCLENSMDRGAWQAADLGVSKSRTRLSVCIHILYIHTHTHRHTHVRTHTYLETETLSNKNYIAN